MREIRFRVFYRGKMYPVLELHGYVHPMIAIAFEMELDGLGLRHVSLDSEHVEGLMQYTGLTDKNGKEIYEGDIVRIKDCEIVDTIPVNGEWKEIYEDCIGYVFYEEGGFHVTGHSSGPLPIWSFSHENVTEDIEVAGNIHENPELLNQGV